GVAPFHLRQLGGSWLLLDDRAADAAPAELERKREPARTGADNKNLGAQLRALPAPVALTRLYRARRFANIPFPPACCPGPPMADLDLVLEELVTANRILAHEGVVDGF